MMDRESIVLVTAVVLLSVVSTLMGFLIGVRVHL